MQYRVKGLALDANGTLFRVLKGVGKRHEEVECLPQPISYENQ